MTVPAWMWAVSVAALAAVVAAEIVLTSRVGRGSFTARGAIAWVGIYVSLAVIFGLGVGIMAGWVTAGQFYAGYLTEYSLSLDNLFIFYVIMGWFAVAQERKHRVLLLGIGLALALRSVFIVAGAAALNRFGWLFYPLGGILIWTAVGLITGRQDSQPGLPGRLLSWMRRLAAGGDHGGRLAARPMLLLVAVIGVADLLFAVDSIPAVFGITASAWLVVACNAFALMGLRQLYALLARVLDRIVYLNTGLGVICGSIGAKLLLHALR
jgi:tellurite resistance protein TerC